jgi:hypothetical protein
LGWSTVFCRKSGLSFCRMTVCFFRKKKTSKEQMMTKKTHVELEEGRVYRTEELRVYGANPTRLAHQLEQEGKLHAMAHGLYACLKQSKFGQVPPSSDALMRAFLKGSPYVFTGPTKWNALRLGTSVEHAAELVYNTKRSGSFELGGRRFVLRRVAFPAVPTPEWYVIDLFEHAAQAASSPEQLAPQLMQRLTEGVFDANALEEMAKEYGTKRTHALICAVCAKVRA